MGAARARCWKLLPARLSCSEQTGLENSILAVGYCKLTQAAQAELLPYNKINLCSLKTEPRCSNLSIKHFESFYLRYTLLNGRIFLI